MTNNESPTRRKANKKRKHAQYEEDDDQLSNIGVAATLAQLKNPELPPKDLSGSPTHDHHDERGPDENGWTKVSKGVRARRNKRRRKETEVHDTDSLDKETQTVMNGKKKNNYPAVTYAALHTIQSSVKLSDLQSLLLYCLADGTAPQWLSVRHHGQIQKAVVLFVPGLEKAMFDGNISLPDPMPDDASTDEPFGGDSMPNASPKAETESHVASQKASHDVYRPFSAEISPDAFLPLRLSVDKLPSPLHPLADIFEHMWPIKAAGDEKYHKVFSPLHSMLTSPIPKTQDEKRAQRNGKGPEPVRDSKAWENMPTPITAFITSKEDLLENNYVLHPVGFITEAQQAYRAQRNALKQGAEDGWVDSKIDKLEDADVADFPKGSLTAGRSILALDCEMCLVEGGESALTRISLVNWDGTVIMDELVKPSKPIIDYLTPYSGITPAALGPISTTLSDIQTRLLSLLTPQTILIGHSLDSDLTALKLTHPFIIDTSLLYPHPRGPPLKSSLKWLSQKYLSREIQRGHGATGHDSIEDARACLDLVRLKCEKGLKWGSMDAERESIFKRLSRVAKAGSDGGKKGAIIDHGAPEKNFGQMATYAIGCSSDAEVVDGVRRAVLGDEDGSVISGGGVDLTWARFREVETLRGWSNDNRNPASTSQSDPRSDPEPAALSAVVASTVSYIKTIYDLLPACTLLIVYSGTGDPRPLAKLQEMQRRFKEEYKTKKWDQLSVKWTDREEQAIKHASKMARSGIGLVGVK